MKQKQPQDGLVSPSLWRRIVAHVALALQPRSDDANACPDDDVLAAWLERSSPVPNDPVLRHIAHCAQCYERVLIVSDNMALLDADAQVQAAPVAQAARPSPIARVMAWLSGPRMALASVLIAAPLVLLVMRSESGAWSSPQVRPVLAQSVESLRALGPQLVAVRPAGPPRLAQKALRSAEEDAAADAFRAGMQAMYAQLLAGQALTQDANAVQGFEAHVELGRWTALLMTACAQQAIVPDGFWQQQDVLLKTFATRFPSRPSPTYRTTLRALQEASTSAGLPARVPLCSRLDELKSLGLQ